MYAVGASPPLGAPRAVCKSRKFQSTNLPIHRTSQPLPLPAELVRNRPLVTPNERVLSRRPSQGRLLRSHLVLLQHRCVQSLRARIVVRTDDGKQMQHSS